MKLRFALRQLPQILVQHFGQRLHPGKRAMRIEKAHSVRGADVLELAGALRGDPSDEGLKTLSLSLGYGASRVHEGVAEHPPLQRQVEGEQIVGLGDKVFHRLGHFFEGGSVLHHSLADPVQSGVVDRSFRIQQGLVLADDVPPVVHLKQADFHQAIVGVDACELYVEYRVKQRPRPIVRHRQQSFGGGSPCAPANGLGQMTLVRWQATL